MNVVFLCSGFSTRSKRIISFLLGVNAHASKVQVENT